MTLPSAFLCQRPCYFIAEESPDAGNCFRCARNDRHPVMKAHSDVVNDQLQGRLFHGEI